MSLDAIQALSSGNTASSPRRVAQAEAAAKDFSAMFTSQMLAPMWEGIEVNEYFGGGHGEEVFRGLMLQEYGKIAAAGDSYGLAAQVKGEMLKIQEAKL
jgi:Rod binding domain-containing protein